MKFIDKYSGIVVIFLTAAMLLIAAPLVFSFDDFIMPIFIIAGIICLILGGFTLLFTGNEPADPKVIGLLPAAGSLNLHRIALDSGISGKASFLPRQLTEESKIMQFNPVSTYYGDVISTRRPFSEKEPYGFLTIPFGDPLYQLLKKKNDITIPKKVEDLNLLLSETMSDVFELSLHVTTAWETNKVTVTLHGYRLIEGCNFINDQSPGCCSYYPCPVCSLCGILIVECINKFVTLEQCSVTANDMSAVFSFY